MHTIGLDLMLKVEDIMFLWRHMHINSCVTNDTFLTDCFVAVPSTQTVPKAWETLSVCPGAFGSVAFTHFNLL